MAMFTQILEFLANHYILSGTFLLLLILLIVQSSRRSGKNLTSSQLTALVNRDQAVVLDIRAKKDFESGHIVDAINIPTDALKTRMGELQKYQDKLLVIVCASGVNAGSAAAELQKAGYQVARLAGGMTTWRNDNLPVVK